ncbi:MAG: glycosyltransferase [Candidatus Obscuribacterales bacterium]|nr:glycosyltransferase [Candidatus Obscuribacterales bacterium]
MRIAIVSNDTRGGVQPYVALGIGLAQAGHDVRVVAPANHSSLFTNTGLKLFPLSGPTTEEVNEAARIAEKGTLATMAFMAKEMPKMIFQSTKETLNACEGVDIITGGVGGMVTGIAVADKLQVPFIQTHLQPVAAPSREYPGVMLGALPDWAGDLGRLLSHHLSEQLLWMPFQGAMSEARTKVLGLNGKSRSMEGQAIIYGFSPRVVPLPDNKKEKRYTTGYWILPTSNFNPPEDLQTFLDQEKPVVSIGFGSMSSNQAERVTELVQQAAANAGLRLILLTGSGGLKEIVGNDDLYCLSEVPHEWLFRKVSAIVHHGGAGTTAAALRSGVPNIVVPFGVDQPFWGSRVAALGVGPKPIPHARLSVDKLTIALQTAVSDQAMRTRAADLGTLLRAEDGVSKAVECFNRLAQT